jgi:D-aminopeptidase
MGGQMSGLTNARPRARELGISIGELPAGPLNGITDVDGVLVGQVTVWHGAGALRPGHGPARTGVTVILPHAGNVFLDRPPAAFFQFNGFGKCVGIEQIEELGVLETPIALTSTLSVGRVADALISHAIATTPTIGISMSSVNPFVGECNDGWLNDIQGRHITEGDVLRAIESASAGPVEEGTVGAGTGMSAFGYKGGIGTSSRMTPEMLGGWTVGVLVLANFGSKRSLLIDGVQVGRDLAEDDSFADKGSIMMIVATDAPLIDRQLGRLARRAILGLARTGSNGGHGSGDVVLAFSTATSVRRPYAATGWTLPLDIVAEDGPDGSSEAIDALFQATAEATEESILNAIFRATTVVGRDDHRREAIPIERVVEILRAHGKHAVLPEKPR